MPHTLPNLLFTKDALEPQRAREVRRGVVELRELGFRRPQLRLSSFHATSAA